MFFGMVPYRTVTESQKSPVMCGEKAAGRANYKINSQPGGKCRLGGQIAERVSLQ